jgi:hypothetical protein
MTHVNCIYHSKTQKKIKCVPWVRFVKLENGVCSRHVTSGLDLLSEHFADHFSVLVAVDIYKRCSVFFNSN